MFKFAISTWLYADRPLDIALRDFRNAGFESVELWANRVHLDPRYLEDFPSTMNMIKKSGAEIHSIHAPFHGLHIGSNDPELLFQSEQHLVKTLEYASSLSAPIVVVHPLTFALRTGSGTDVEGTVELFERLADRAESLGVRIAVENLPVAPPAYTSVAGLMELFPDPRIAICLDVAHSFLNHRDIIAEIELASARLISCHVSNNDGIRDSHNNIDEGLIDMDSVLDKLADYPTVTPVFEINGRGIPEQVLESVKQSRMKRTKAQE